MVLSAAAVANHRRKLVTRKKLSPRDHTRLRVAACALSDIAWRDHDDLRASESFRRLLQFPFIGVDHLERAYLAAIVHARYSGRSNDPCLETIADLLSPARLRRARILGQALQLGYRFSGGVPEILTTSRLVIGKESVVLAVGDHAKAPDSEAVIERLQTLAESVGVARVEIKVIAN